MITMKMFSILLALSAMTALCSDILPERSCESVAQVRARQYQDLI